LSESCPPRRSDDGPRSLQACIDACNACAEACDYCEAACLKEREVAKLALHPARHRLRRAVPHGGELHVARKRLRAELCELCATICEACARECAEHPMRHCQECAQACRRCAEECRRVGSERTVPQSARKAAAAPH